MTTRNTPLSLILLLLLTCCQKEEATTGKEIVVQDEALPSWNEGNARQSIISFVTAATDSLSSGYVPIKDRIAVFDNDGTLWCEQPFYFQLFFAIDRVKQLAPEHPEWKNEQPFKGAIEGDMHTVLSGGIASIVKLVMATHAGMTTDEFEAIVLEWIRKAKHPKYNQLFTDLTYQPMVEVLDYLRANNFKTYIVSGGGVEFMRPWVEAAYGIPKEQVIGSYVSTKLELNSEGHADLIRLPELAFNDDAEGKPIAINRSIGKRPVIAFGNSDGDLQMLQWTTSGTDPRLGVIIHHTDSVREAAYDRQSKIGHLDKALDESAPRKWTVVSMEADWNKIFRFEN